MTHVLRFLPAVEEDILAGYAWYEEKPQGLGRSFCACFMPAPERFRAIHCSTQGCIVPSDVVYSGDFLMPSIFE